MPRDRLAVGVAQGAESAQYDGGGVVTIVEDSVTDQLSADFTRACVERAKARLLMRRKDSTVHRAAVTEWDRAVDVLLDMLLQVRGAPAHVPPPPPPDATQSSVSARGACESAPAGSAPP